MLLSASLLEIWPPVADDSRRSRLCPIDIVRNLVLMIWSLFVSCILYLVPWSFDFTLGQEFLDHVTAYIGETKVAALVAEGELGVIET